MEAFVKSFLLEASNLNATDIHFMLNENNGHIKFRIRGELELFKTIPSEQFKKVINYLKFIGNLNINEHKIPQSGKAKIKINNEIVSIRISTLPLSLMNEAIVIRMLKDIEFIKDVQLFYNDEKYNLITNNFKKDSGLIIFSGPTGSGKTTLMYQLLFNIINTSKKQIISVEDPIELEMSNMIQVEINEKANITYSNILKGILRCDPDIILFGEVRDQHVAYELIKASLSGHLVVTTFHSKSATGTIDRLREYGLLKEDIIQSVSFIVNQRIIHTQNTSFIIYESLNNEDIKNYLSHNEFKYVTLYDELIKLKSLNIINNEEFTRYAEKIL